MLDTSIILQQTVSYALLCKIIRHPKDRVSLKKTLFFPNQNGKRREDGLRKTMIYDIGGQPQAKAR